MRSLRHRQTHCRHIPIHGCSKNNVELPPPGTLEQVQPVPAVPINPHEHTAYSCGDVRCCPWARPSLTLTRSLPSLKQSKEEQIHNENVQRMSSRQHGCSKTDGFLARSSALPHPQTIQCSRCSQHAAVIYLPSGMHVPPQQGLHHQEPTPPLCQCSQRHLWLPQELDL